MLKAKELKSGLVFAPIWELIHLAGPVGMLLLVLFFGLKTDYSSQERLLMRIIAINILGDGYHVMYSLWNLFFMEEFRKVNLRLNLSPLKWGVAFVGLFAFFAIGHDSGFFKEFFPVRLLAIWVICLIPTLHRNRQSMGLSLLYNMKHKQILGDEARTKFETLDQVSRKWEHRASYLLLTGTFFVLLSERPEKYRFLHLHKSVILEIAYVLLGLGVFSLARAIYLLRGERQLPVLKSVFGLRQLFQVLSPFSTVAQVSAAAVHGLEYNILQAHMMKRSVSLKKLGFSVLVPLALFLLVDTGLDAAVALKNLGWVTNRWILNSMILLSVSLAFLHYAMDSIYFRFKNLAVREEILPLIAEAPVTRKRRTEISASDAA